MQKRVKIVATVGPASEDNLKALIQAGADCIRINTAYRDLAYYEHIIRTVRKLSTKPILLDLKGSDIRLVCATERAFDKGEKLTIHYLRGDIHFTKQLSNALKKGDSVSFKDGRYKAKVVQSTKTHLQVEFLSPAKIYDGVGVNISAPLQFTQLLSKKDKQVIKLAKKLDVEYVALSFTKSANDVRTLRSALGDDSIKIIAKIESAQGVKNAEEILECADGIMVARGDLGIELADEIVPIIQKQLISAANNAGKIVITATEMLESMIHNDRPTRAETSDIANAVLDGTDAVMLSAESATGKYPIGAVKEMARVIQATQDHIHTHIHPQFGKVSDLVTASVSNFCHNVDLDAIVTITRSGYTTLMISRFRNNENIIAITRSAKVARQLELVYGAQPVHYQNMPKTDQVRKCLKYLLDKRLLNRKQRVAVTAGSLTKAHGTNSVTIVDLADI